jgi:hypothetical protein
LYLALWEEGAKGPEGKISWKKLKSKMKPLDYSPKVSQQEKGTRKIK